VEDTFVIWPHGPDKLNDFLIHLNSIHQCIQFTMQIERKGHLPFLDTDIYRRHIRRLSGYRVYHKPTHTNLYLNTGSHHLPHWNIGLVFSAMETACMRSWCS
jgi:hypothetical protein